MVREREREGKPLYYIRELYFRPISGLDRIGGSCLRSCACACARDGAGSRSDTHTNCRASVYSGHVHPGGTGRHR